MNNPTPGNRTSLLSRRCRNSRRHLPPTPVSLLCFFFLFALIVYVRPAAAQAAVSFGPEKPVGPQRNSKTPPVLYIQAGMVYPVGTPPIKNGIVAIQGNKIIAVEEERFLLPEGAHIKRFPGKHLVPGFIDAASRILARPSAFEEAGGSDAALISADGIDPFDHHWKDAARQGITCAYISFGPSGILPGIGSIIRLNGGLFQKELCISAKAQLESTLWPQASSFRDPDGGSSLSSLLFSGTGDTGAASKSAEKEPPIGEFKHREPIIDHETPRPVTDDEARRSLDTAVDRKTGKPETEIIIIRSGSYSPRRARRSSSFDLLSSYAALRGVLKQAQAYQRKQTWHEQDLGAWERKIAEIKQQIAEAKKEGKTVTIKQMPEKPAAPDPYPLGDAFLPILKGEKRLRIWADSREEINLVLKLAREFSIKVVLCGALEAHLAAEEIAEAGQAVILVPPASAPSLRSELNVSRSCAATLFEAGVQFGFGTGTAGATGTHLLRHFIAQAIAHGLNPEYALRAATLTNAKLLGAAGRIGSLAPGKEAHLVVFDGPPFSTASRAELVISGGKTVFTKGKNDEKKK